MRIALAAALLVLAVACSGSTAPTAEAAALPDPRLRIAELAEVPDDGEPFYAIGSRVYLVDHADEGLIALFEKDPFLGCRLLLVPDEGLEESDAFVADDAARFYDPCRGSQFDGAGLWLAGPSPRSMDRMPITVVDATIYFDGAAPPVPVPRPDPVD